MSRFLRVRNKHTLRVGLCIINRVIAGRVCVLYDGDADCVWELREDLLVE